MPSKSFNFDPDSLSLQKTFQSSMSLLNAFFGLMIIDSKGLYLVCLIK